MLSQFTRPRGNVGSKERDARSVPMMTRLPFGMSTPTPILEVGHHMSREGVGMPATSELL